MLTQLPLAYVVQLVLRLPPCDRCRLARTCTFFHLVIAHVVRAHRNVFVCWRYLTQDPVTSAIVDDEFHELQRLQCMHAWEGHVLRHVWQLRHVLHVNTLHQRRIAIARLSGIFGKFELRDEIDSRGVAMEGVIFLLLSGHLDQVIAVAHDLPVPRGNVARRLLAAAVTAKSPAAVTWVRNLLPRDTHVVILDDVLATSVQDHVTASTAHALLCGDRDLLDHVIARQGLWQWEWAWCRWRRGFLTNIHLTQYVQVVT